MKRIRTLSVLLALIFILMTAASCDQLSALSDIIGEAQNDSDLTGKDYIVYTNSKRDEVMSEYVGTKVAEKQAELLLDNIELTYYDVEGEPGKYEIYVDNANKSYFYNGVILLKSSSEEIKINVRMLAPEWYEFFTVELKGDPVDYEYFIEGSMYEWKKELLIDHDYRFDYEGLDDFEDMLIIDEPLLTETIVNDFAKYLYEMDSIYNYSESFTYYLTTESDFEPGNRDTTYTIFVDTANQEAVVTFTEEGEDPVDSKLTFSK
ncbi:MAG: hypothetical protein JW817_05615 [Clostridiales bacterium]|nr:hypothetical protein [Clostridiales bacterium]